MRTGARLLCGVLLLCALNVGYMVLRQREVLEQSADILDSAASEPPPTITDVPLLLEETVQHHPQQEQPTSGGSGGLPCLRWNSGHPIVFQWADPSYARNMSEHRGGWKSVMQGLLDEGVLRMKKGDASEDEAESDGGTVLLIDIAEKWFVWDQKPGLTRPWIGVTHLVLNPPPPFQGMDLQGLLENRNFQQSLPHCVGLVVLHQDGVQPMERKLRDLLSADSQPPRRYLPRVCPLVHPIGVESTARHYDPNVDLPRTIKDGGILLLGQQYRRVATIHRFQGHRRRRFWLSGTQQPRVIKHVLGAVLKPSLKHEKVSKDLSVEMVYAESHSDYDDWLRHNLVVIDLVCATANNAVLEILALHVPAFVTRLPSTVEYLGANYPLLFDSFDDLQALLEEDDETLAHLLREGHEYLKNLDTAHLSVSALGEGLRECAILNAKRQCEIL